MKNLLPATTLQAKRALSGYAELWEEAANSLYKICSAEIPVIGLALYDFAGPIASLVSSVGEKIATNELAQNAALDGALASDRFTALEGIWWLPVSDTHKPFVLFALKTAAEFHPADSHKLTEHILLLMENILLRQRQIESREREKQRLQRLAALYEVGQAIHKRSDDELLPLICEKAADVMQAQACSLMLRNENNELIIVASFGIDADVVRHTRIPRGVGIAWHVALGGQPILLNESPAQQIGDMTIPIRADIQSSMCVPLRGTEERSLGVLSIRRMIPAPEFEEEDLQLFSVFADQAALAISNASLLSDLKRRVTEMATVNRLTAAINSTLDLEFVLAQIADCIIDVVGFGRCIVYLTDPRKGLESRIVRGYSENENYPAIIPDPDGVMALAIREQIVIIAEGEELATASPVTDAESIGGHAVIAAPIVVRKQTIGVIVADNKNTGRLVETSHVDLLNTFVNHAGLAIENSRLYEAMEQKYSELNVLYELSRQIGQAYGLDNAVELLLEVALKAVPYSSASFALVNDTAETTSVHATKHINQDRPVPWQVMEETELSQLVSQLRERKTVHCDEDNENDRIWFLACKRLLDYADTLLFMPLISDGRAVGVLVLARDGENEFSSNDIKLLSIIGSHASVVIKNAATYERSVQEKVLELSALYEFSQRISTAGTLNEAFESILAIVSNLVECDECLIWTVDQDTSDLELRASRWGGRARESDQTQPQVDTGLAAWTFRERKAVAMADIHQDVRFNAGVLTGTRVRSLMSIPLMVQDEVVGVLSVHSYTPNMYTERQVRILSVVASQAASIYRGLEALTALTSYTDNILTSVAAGVVTLDTGGTIVSWNRAAEEILELSSKSALGQEFFGLLESLHISKDGMTRLGSTLDNVMQSGDTERGVEVTANMPDERELHLTLSVSQLQNHAAEPLGLVIIFEDVTRQVHMHTEVRRMHELAAIGQLAASIAHELRNPLSSIKGAAQFLQHEAQDPSTSEFLGIIVEEVDGLNKIASEFLDFARQLKIDATEVSLPEVLQKQMSLLGPQLVESKIVAKADIAKNIPTILCDQKHIEQVLLNLILNSVQAMPDGGKLTLAIKMSQIWSGHVQIDIKDSGVGIPESRLGKIFTPFFTTKVKGTGLGLPVVQKIVQNHQGHIEVDSVEGKGTTFRVHLPVKGPRPSLIGELPDSPPDLLERT